MSNAHFTYFKIENFKRFDSIELTDIGQFNLIVGDNNVGKTSLLEAMLVDEDLPTTMFNYHKTLLDRGMDFKLTIRYDDDLSIKGIDYPTVNYYDFLAKNPKDQITIKLKTQGARSYEYSKNQPQDSIFLIFKNSHDGGILLGVVHKFEFNSFGITNYYNLHQDQINKAYYERQMPFIQLKNKSATELFDEFNKYIAVKRSLTKALTDNLKIIISDLEEVKALELDQMKQIGFGLSGKDTFQWISTFGEGTSRIFEILMSIIRYKNHRLFIDEIDTGIHHSRMRSFLKTVFKLAKEHDVQLFMTTHSAECQQAFLEVFEDTELAKEQENARNYTLVETQDGKVDVQKFNFEAMKFAVESGFEIRGGG